MFKKLSVGFLALILALALGSTTAFAKSGPSGSSSGGSRSSSTSSFSSGSSRGPSGTTSSKSTSSSLSTAKSRGPSGTSDNATSRAKATTTKSGPSGTGNTVKPNTGSGSSRRTTTTTTTTTAVAHRGYYSGWSSWGGYCMTCFTGPYAYGPVGFAGYYPPAGLDFIGVIVIVTLLVLLIIWWRSRRNAVYDGDYVSSTHTRTHTHDDDVWP